MHSTHFLCFALFACLFNSAKADTITDVKHGFTFEVPPTFHAEQDPNQAPNLWHSFLAMSPDGREPETILSIIGLGAKVSSSFALPANVAMQSSGLSNCTVQSIDWKGIKVSTMSGSKATDDGGIVNVEGAFLPFANEAAVVRMESNISAEALKLKMGVVLNAFSNFETPESAREKKKDELVYMLAAIIGGLAGVYIGRRLLNKYMAAGRRKDSA